MALEGLSRLSSLNPSFSSQKIDFLNDYERQRSTDTQGWQYSINEYLFRDEWDFSNSKRIGCFGCSVTVGVGVKTEDSFVGILRDSTDYSVLNFGISGASIHHISRVFSEAIRLIDIDIAIITLPDIARFMLMNDSRVTNIGYNWYADDQKSIHKKIYTALTEEWFSAFAKDHIRWISAEAKSKNIRPIFYGHIEESQKIITEILPEDMYIDFDPAFMFDRTARDNMHPGKEAHRKHAEKLLNTL
jgi:hypothetical protein